MIFSFYNTFEVMSMLKFFYFPIFLCYAFAFGSFYTVIISRYFTQQGFRQGYSCCPHCHHRLFYRDMVPVLSWLLLKGHCRYCGNKIAVRYPLIELSTAIGFSLAYWTNDFNLTLLLDCIVVSALILLSWIDFEYMIIPDSSILLIFVSSLALLCNEPNLLANRLTHALIFSFILFLFAFFSKALGYGDIKLIGVSTLYLGLERMFLALILSCFSATVIELLKVLLLRKKMISKIPFGPYLSIGIMLVMFYYEPIIQGYLKIMGI